MKICSNVPSHMTMSIYGEKLKKSSSLEVKRPVTLKLGIQHRVVLPMFSYDDPGLTLTIFMTGSNLFPNASAWVKAYTALSANVFPSLF